MKVNLAKALKIKNRLAGELSRLRSILKRENSRRDDNPSKVDPKEIHRLITTTAEKLIFTKSAISRANIDIYATLAELEEIKSEISYLQLLPVKEGIEKTSVGYSKEVAEYNWTAYLNQASIDEQVKKLQIMADERQDRIDAYNATNLVEIAD